MPLNLPAASWQRELLDGWEIGPTVVRHEDRRFLVLERHLCRCPLLSAFLLAVFSEFLFADWLVIGCARRSCNAVWLKRIR
jgi:hypothetical protein